MVAALKVLRKMIKFDGEGNLQRVQHLGVVEKVLRWVGDVEMTNMVKAAALGVLN
jgi:predicted ATPase